MLSTRSQQHKHEELQSQLNLFSEKIKRLRKALAIETDVANRFKLETQINDEEAERAALERRLDELGQLSPPPLRVPIPTILPYLSDRSEQETALRQALDLLMQKKSRRPFICIIHGDEYECHDRYGERLQQVSFPKIFRLDPERAAIKDYPLSWPAGSGQNFSETLRANLAEKLLNDSMASIHTMSAALSRYEMPVLFRLHLLTENWPHDGAHSILALIRFWQEWPDLAPGQRLVVVLSLKYLRPEKLGFWQKRKVQKLNETIHAFFTGLNFSAFDRIHGLALPELKAITRSEAEDWVRMHAREFCDTDELLPKIRELYKRADLLTAEARIPMERLAAELKKLLNEHRL